MEYLEKIKQLEEMLINPKIRKSRGDLEKILAENFIEFSSSGMIFNKTEIIQTLIGETDTTYKIQDFKTQQLSERTVLVTYIAIKNENIYSLRSSIWKMYNEQWQLVFHQGTNTKDSHQNSNTALQLLSPAQKTESCDQ